MKRSYTKLFLSSILVLIFCSTSYAEENRFPVKFNIRTGYATFYSLIYSETRQYSYFFTDLYMGYYYHPKFSVGLGFDLHQITIYENTDYWSVRLSGKYYYAGQGVPTKTVNKDVKIESWKPFAFYIGPELRRFTYSLGYNALTVWSDYEKTGNFYTISGITGVDWHLTQHWDLNMELTTTFKSLSETDVRIKPYYHALLVGIGLIW